jgi:hypothetical protein
MALRPQLHSPAVQWAINRIGRGSSDGGRSVDNPMRQKIPCVAGAPGFQSSLMSRTKRGQQKSGLLPRPRKNRCFVGVAPVASSCAHASGESAQAARKKSGSGVTVAYRIDGTPRRANGPPPQAGHFHFQPTPALMPHSLPLVDTPAPHDIFPSSDSALKVSATAL